VIEDEGKLPSEAPPDRYGEALLYDFAKFLTTLSLLALGGVLTLTQADPNGDIKKFNILLALGAIALAGTMAVSIASALADARSNGKEPSRRLPLYLKTSMALLGIGVGAVLQMWWDTLQ
jgi:hypothetical protein